jgi:hypothetical protein
VWNKKQKRNFHYIYLPFALERKYKNADREWIWQFVFPSNRISQDPRSKVEQVKTLATLTNLTRNRLNNSRIRFRKRKLG